jgi:hypothetical protein
MAEEKHGKYSQVISFLFKRCLFSGRVSMALRDYALPDRLYTRNR